ncbi:MAG: RHS repeat-associated core domain-containing protein, partial [Thermogemmata sp.]|nr:RHS repeat-associated core domain-containing protein [Thermogemmata sp.]
MSRAAVSFHSCNYFPTLGRWTSLDPIRYAAGDVNLYRFIINAPTVYTDPSGLFAAPFPDDFSFCIAIQNTAASGTKGCGAGLWWAVTFENLPDPARNARLGYQPPHDRWQRSFHFD